MSPSQSRWSGLALLTLALGTLSAKSASALEPASWPLSALTTTNSAKFEDRHVFLGDVAATKRAPGAVLADNAEIAIGSDAIITGSVTADTVYIWRNATVNGDVTYNGLTNEGTITGAQTSGLVLPLPTPLPALPTITTGSANVSLSANQKRTLLSGNYRDVTLANGNGGQKTVLTLSGGLYQFNNVTLANDGRIECASACEIRVKGRLFTGNRDYIGPKPGVFGLGSGNVQLLIAGTNGNSSPLGTPRAALVGDDSALHAYVLVPNGTLQLGHRSVFRGKLIGRDIILGFQGDAQGQQLALIALGPQPQQTRERDVATFTVSAAGGNGITYQWQRDGVNIPGATGPSYTTPATVFATDDQSRYRVIIVNEAGTVTSAEALLTVIPCADTDETCDGFDDDCDGQLDEEYVVACDAAGEALLGCADGVLVPEYCDDWNVCNGAETCSQGECHAALAIDLDDEDPCTVDRCDPASGVFHELAAAGTNCGDSNDCNGVDLCDSAGACVYTAHAAGESCGTVWAEAPVALTPVVDANGESQAASATTDKPVHFDVPEHLNVTTGNAGNGTAVLRFRNADGPVVTCTYFGAASVAHPTEELDRMKGLRYVLDYCDNGFGAGDPAKATWIEAEVLSGDSESSAGQTTIAMHLGAGCQDTIEAAMSPADVAALKQDFDWNAVDNLAEVDPEGYPALWHGLIYIERKEQLTALDKMRIMWSPNPLSASYREQFIGKCGRVEHATDGLGVVVYAVFPAKFYNMMRDFALQAETAGVPAPFRFVIPSTPDEPDFVNSDGSLRYQALADSRFHEWLAARATLQPAWWDGPPASWVSDAASDTWEWIVGAASDGVDGIETGFDYAAASWDTVVDFTANQLDNGWELAQEALQELVLVFGDPINVKLDISIVNRDPIFPAGPITRAWGPSLDPLDPTTRPEIVPAGTKVRVRQWGWGFLPVMGEDTMDDNGVVNIEAIQDAAGRGGDVCIQLESDYAMMTTDLIPNEVCNFAEDVLDFRGNIDTAIAIDQDDLFAFTQFKDSADYSKQIIGHDPQDIQVLIGWAANTATSTLAGSHRAMCLCLDFPSTSVGAIGVALDAAVVGGIATAAAIGPIVAGATAIVGGAAFLAAPVVQKDLWWPDSSAEQSRGVASHEYGHFELCSLMFEKEGAESLTGLMMRLGDGEESRDDDITLMLETWADAFAMQVTGGINYVDIGDSAATTRMNYCTSSPCLDQNFSGRGDSPADDDFKDEHARWQTLVQDAFDSADNSTRNTNALSNGDYWEFDPTRSCPNGYNCVRYSPSAYFTNDDEPVSLPGAGWSVWVERFLDRSRGGDGFFSLEYVPTAANMIGGLADTMRDFGASWCDACEVVAAHSPAVSELGRLLEPVEPRTFEVRFERWKACRANGQLRGFVGAPDSEDLHLNASCETCPPLHFAELSTGICQACPAGSVPTPRGEVATNPAPGSNDRCELCPAGSVPTPANTCNPCAAGEITVGSECVPCGVGLRPDAAATACVACSIDEVRDWTAIGESDCQRVLGTPLAANSGAMDTCPEQFVMLVDGLAAEAAEGIGVGVVHEGVLSAEICEASASEAAAFAVASSGAFSPLVSAPLTAGVGSYCDPEVVGCNSCDLTVAMTVTGPQLVAAGNSVVFASRTLGPAGDNGFVNVSSFRPFDCDPE